MNDRILFHDDNLIAVNKIAGEIVVTDRWKKEPKENILLYQLGNYLRCIGHNLDDSGRDLYPLHRLDRDTSGVVLFAKNQEAHRVFSKLFEERKIEKVYWAICVGDPDWDKCEIKLPIKRAEGKKGRGRAVIHIHGGKDAVTQFEVRERFGDLTWLEARPVTGKLHQIRIHLRALGYPLPEDVQYGFTGWTSKMHPNIQFERMPLHARFLRFEHPFTNTKIEISAPLDCSLRERLDALKKSEKIIPAGPLQKIR